MSRKRYNFTLSANEIAKLDERRGMIPRSMFLGYLIKKGHTRADLQTMANDWCGHGCSANCNDGCDFSGRLEELLDHYEESNQ